MFFSLNYLKKKWLRLSPRLGLSKDNGLIDKLSGMLLLGAYGDALGAPHEQKALRGGYASEVDKLGRLVEVEHYHAIRCSGDIMCKRSPWWIWADPEAVSGMKGVPTDDTAFRFLHLHPWLEYSLKSGEPLIESGFVAWLKNTRRLPPDLFLSGVPESHIEQFEAFVKMFEAEKNGEDESFYRRGVPVFFGPFMYLELAAADVFKSKKEVLLKYYNFCALDQGVGKAVTACFTALLTVCLKEESVDKFRTLPFLKKTVEDLLLIAENHQLGGVGELRHLMREAIDAGIKVRESSYQSYVEKQAEYFEASLRTLDLRPFDPLMLWWQFWSSLSFANTKPLDALALTAAGPGDADTIPSFMGSILGALYGLEQLNGEKVNSYALKSEITLMEQNVKSLFRKEISAQADMIRALARQIDEKMSPE